MILAILAVLFAGVAGLIPVSKKKGWVRVASSFLAGAALAITSLAQVTEESRFWPGIMFLVFGFSLCYIGLRKLRRDPTGLTRSDKVL
jgi:hypothetical protein